MEDGWIKCIVLQFDDCTFSLAEKGGKIDKAQSRALQHAHTHNYRNQ